MTSSLNEHPEEPTAETPEDVAILYSWANLHGAKYRDFSASRREYRAQVRHRAAEETRQAELRAQAEAEAAAQRAESAARDAERAARSIDGSDNASMRERALNEAEDAGRRAAAERVEAARRAEAAANAEAVARKEEREIAEAHASAQRQAAHWTDSESRRRNAAGPQPTPLAPGLTRDPYEILQGAGQDPTMYTSRQAEYTQPARGRDESRVRDEYGARMTSEREPLRSAEAEVRRYPQGFRPDEASGMRPAYRPATQPESLRARINSGVSDGPRFAASLQSTPMSQSGRSRNEPVPELIRSRADERSIPSAESAPAWLYASTPAPRTAATFPDAAPATDSLQDSRERVASRWFALKGVFEQPSESPAALASVRQREVQPPILAIFALAGGVGKTSLVATLGRTLSALGEKVLLADTTSHGLLPYYFGASELRPGVVRTFSPPSGSTDAPIYLVSFDIDQRAKDHATQDLLAEEIARSSSGTHRALLDLNSGSGWLIRSLSRLRPTVLVPVAPDMNSVISLQTLENYFKDVMDEDGNPILPYYILNHFDASLPLHLDVREVLRRQLGERLLPFVVRRAPAVSEALAEGMTVVDYAPDAAIAVDYMNIAIWLRNLSAPATQGFRNVRWSER